jgi:hypothetical protein
MRPPRLVRIHPPFPRTINKRLKSYPYAPEIAIGMLVVLVLTALLEHLRAKARFQVFGLFR